MFFRSFLLGIALTGAISASAVESFCVGESQPQRFDTRHLAADGFGAAVVHDGGALVSNECWVAAVSHVVYGTLVVPTNVTLTVERGAVVKFVGGGIQADGVLVAEGVSFTDLDDDSIGGDLRGNGWTQPLVSYEITGMVQDDADTSYLCFDTHEGFVMAGNSRSLAFDTRGYGAVGIVGTKVHLGEVTSDETWAAGETHVVYGVLHVAAGVTLTIQPGAVVKFVGGGLSVDGLCMARGVTFTDLDDASRGLSRMDDALPYASYVLDGNIETDDTTVTLFRKGREDGFASPGVSRVFRLETDVERVRFAGDPREVAFSTAWDGSSAVAVTETHPDGSTVVLTNGVADSTGMFLWDAGETPGLYTLRHVTDTNELTASFYRLFNAKAHSGPISETNVWEAGVVHVIDRSVTVNAGGLLIIEPGAVVKFFPKSGLTIEAGGICTARDVIFTSIHDTSVGGDTLGEGGATEPGEEEYLIVGYVRDSVATEYRYGTHSLSGTITDVETWEADRVYVIDGTLTVAAGAGLTIERGTIVKFTSGSTLVIETGATCSAEGVIFTHIADDSAGGDTMGDGDETAPEIGAYAIEGPILDDATTQYRYSAPVVMSGTISKSTFWRSRNVYRVTGNLTIASGVTLTIMSGAIVKFDDGKSLTVASGATLNAIGTRAQPIVFTSVKDDEHGGDTNGDDDSSVPMPGDWVKVGINGGTANFNYAQILYSSKNSTTGAINMNGGKVVFNNGIIAHGLYDGVGVESGDFSMANSVVTDCLLAFRHWPRGPIVNCVIYDCGRLTQGGGQNFSNCIFAKITEAWEAFGFPQNGTTYRNCCFWNEGGSVLMGEGRQDAMTVCGKNGNVWGDPKFLNLGNWDFRITANSLCVDAGDGSSASSTDYFGQTRQTVDAAKATGTVAANGNYPDIGIYEVMPREVDADVDLATDMVKAPVTMVVGEEITVSWAVKNVGSEAAAGQWTDRIELICANGAAVLLGEKSISARIPAAGEQAFSGTWKIPAAQTGSVRVRVTANVNRDIFEGTMIANNVAMSDEATLTLPELGALSADAPVAVSVPAKGSMAYQLGTSAAQGGLLIVRTSGALSVRIGKGQVPTADTAFAVAERIADGVYALSLPAGDGIYLSLDNEGDSAVSTEMTLEEGGLCLYANAKQMTPNVGLKTLVFFGNGFDESMEVSLKCGGIVVAAADLKVDSAVKASATFDVNGIAAGTYSLVVKKGADEVSAEMLDVSEKPAVIPAGSALQALYMPKFNCSLDVATSVRASREFVGHIVYSNTGAVAQTAPYLRLTAGIGTLVRFGASDAWTTGLELMATSETYPASQLKPGETVRVPFRYMTTGSAVNLDLGAAETADGDFPWAVNAPYVRPSWASDEYWNACLVILKTNVGLTWNAWLDRMRYDCDYLMRVGKPTHQLEPLWQLEVNEALGVDHAVSTLAGGTDLVRSGRGMGLAFSRSYGASLFSRFRKGILGYGWSDNYSAYAELQDSGNTLALHSGSGSTYRFYKTNGVWKPEDARDRTAVTETSSYYELKYRSGTVQRIAKTNMRVSSIVDNQGNSIAFTYSGNQLVQVKHADGQTLTFTYSGELLVKVEDDQGRVTAYSYEGELLKSVTAFNGLVTRFNYLPADGTPTSRALCQIVYPDGNTKDYTYDSAGRIATMSINGSLMTTEIVRGDFGSYSTIAPNGGVSTVIVGDAGAVMESENALGERVKCQYTEDGLLDTMTGPTGKKVRVSYDAEGNATKSSDPSGAETSFAYSADYGNLTRVTDARGNSFSYGYDKLGRSERITYADDSVERIMYSDRGDITNSVNRRGQSITYAYNAEGDRVSETWASGRTFTWEYDAKGNCTRATDSETGAVTMGYDENERLVRITYPQNRGFTYAYDEYGRTVSRTSFDGFTQKYAYDALGRLKTTTDGEGNPYLENVYDETTGQLVLMKYGNGTVVSNAYDILGRTIGIYHLAGSAPNAERLAFFEYAYDAEGRRISQTTAEGVERYTYDTVGQLTAVSYPDGTEEHFRYDAVGNRMTANGTAYTVNNLNQYLQTVDADGVVTRYEYDADGNMTKKDKAGSVTDYFYDDMNRLVAVTNETEDIRWGCVYDVFGNRTKVIDHGVETEKVFVLGSLPSVAEEYRGTTLKKRQIVVGSTSFATVEDGSVEYSHEDGRMSTCVVSDSDGKVKLTCAVKVFGETRVGDVHSFVKMLGVEYDGATGLYFMRNRYYDAGLGRFVQVDPIGQMSGDVNWYRYCRNESVVNVDPAGLNTLSLICKEIIKLFNNKSNGCKPNEYFDKNENRCKPKNGPKSGEKFFLSPDWERGKLEGAPEGNVGKKVYVLASRARNGVYNISTRIAESDLPYIINCGTAGMATGATVGLAAGSYMGGAELVTVGGAVLTLPTVGICTIGGAALGWIGGLWYGYTTSR